MIVGTASVKIVADVSKLAGDIERQLGRIDVSRIGQELGDQIGRGLRDRVEAQFADLPDLLVDRASDFKAAGQLAGDEFGNGFMDRVKTHLDLLPDLVDGDSLGRQLADDASNGFSQNLSIENALRQQIQNAASSTQSDAEGIGAQINQSISNGMRNRPLDIDFGGAGRDGGNSYGMGFMGAFDRWMNTRSLAPFEGAIRGILGNLVQLQVMQGVIVGLVGAVSSLVSGVVMLSSALAYAAPAALKFANALFAVAQGALVAKGLFSGIGQAISSYTKMQTAAAKATKTAAAETKKSQEDEAERLLRIREARDALNDAIIEGARSNEDAVERVSDAHESLEDAIEGVSDAEENLRDAIEGVSDAEESLSDAIRGEERALRSIDDARRAAQERLEDLQMSLDRASLTEERAALNLKRAEEKLAKARAGGNAQAIYEADLAYREQLQTMREVQERNGDLREEADKAFSEGVDGNQKVLDAQEAYRDAVERTSDAYEALADAQERVRDAQEGIADATERVSDAQRDLKRAMEDVPRVAEDVALRIARAQLNLQKAIKGTDDAMNNSADSLDTAVGNMNDAFAKLDPAAQEFVRFWVNEVLPIFERIKKAGQAEFFPRLTEAIKTLINDAKFMSLIEDAFVETSIVLGDFSKNLAKAFTTPETLTALETILDGNIVILRNLGDAAANLVQPLAQIFAAATPLAEEWSESIKKATERFKEFIGEAAKGGEDSPLAKFFREAQDIASRFWRILKNIGGGIGGVFGAALGPGKYFLGMLEKMTSEWRDKMNDPKNQEEMNKTFTGAATNAVALLDLLGDIGGMLFRLGANPGIAKIAQSIEKVLPTFEKLANDSFNQIADALSRVIEALPEFGEFFMETGTIKAFADTFATVVEKVGDFLGFLTDLNKKFDELTGINILGIAGSVMGFYLAMKLVTGIGGFGVKKIVDGFKSIRDAANKAKDIVSDAFKKIGGFFEGRKASKNAQIEYWGLNPEGTKKGAKAAGKAAKQDFKIEFDAKYDDAKLERDINDIGRKMRKQWEQEAKETAAKARIQSEIIGDGTAEGIEKGLRDKFPELAKVADDAAGVMVREIKKALGIQSPSTVMEKQVGDQMVAGIAKSMTEAEFDAAAKQMVTEIENELRQSAQAANLDQVGRSMGSELERGLKASTETTGTEVGTEIKNDLGRATDNVSGIGAEMGNKVERGLKAATETTGTEVGREISRDFSRGLEVMSVDAFDEGRDAAMAAKRGAKSAGPVVINTVVAGGGAAAGRGAAGAGAATAAGATAAAGSVGRLGKVTAGFSKIAGKLGLKALGKGFLAILGPIGAVIGAVWMIIDVLGMFGISLDSIINFFKNFGTEAPKLWAKITEGFSKAWEAVKTWFSDNFMPWIKELPGKIGEIAGDVWGWIVEKAKIIIPAVGEWFSTSFFPWLISLPGKIANLYINIWGWILDKAWDILKAVGEWFVTSFVPWLVSLPGKIANLAINIWGWILDKAKDILVAIGTWWVDSFVPWLTSLPSKIINLGINIWGWIIDKAKALIGALKTWLTDSFIPWVKGLPNAVKNNIGNLFGALKDKAVDGFNSLKTFFTDTVIPWVKGLPQRFVDGMKGLWDGLKSGAARASNWVTEKINEYIIPSLNKLPFVDLKPLKLIPGYASGGEVRGPNRGDRADNVLARLTPGEYVLTRKMVSQMGPAALEQWRRTGRLPEGGLDWIGKATDWVKGKIDKIDEWLQKGAFFALEKVISTGLNLIPEKDGMVGLIRKYFQSNLDILRKYADKEQAKIDAGKEGSAGTAVPPYKGPVDGWTYPLSRRFPAYTRKGHNPWYAYDIGSPTGIGVIAVSSGRVVTSANLGDRSYGQYIAIVHHDKSRSLYAHLSKRFVSAGTNVRAGERIGLSGNTGGSTGPHLHFELGFADAREMLRRRNVRLAAGGIVRATPGGINAVIGEGGRDERVTPLDSKGRSATEVEMLAELKKLSALWSQGRGGDVFQIYPAPGMSERELAVKVSREVAFRHRRRA